MVFDERLVLDALANLLKGRTAFVIAHRMSTIAGADQVLVFDRGRIVERGTPAELTALAGGLYRSFLELQMGRDGGAESRAGASPGSLLAPSPSCSVNEQVSSRLTYESSHREPAGSGVPVRNDRVMRLLGSFRRSLRRGY